MKIVRIAFSGLLAVVLGALVVLFSPGTASAHAEYLDSDPKMDARLDQAPTTVTVQFAEVVNPNGSDIVVSDVDGKQVSTGPAEVDLNDAHYMRVSMQGDQSEVYVVAWHTVSAIEGHHDAGAFRFFVNVSQMLGSMLDGMNHSASSTDTASVSSGMSPWSGVLIGVLGLAVGSAGGLLLARRPRKAIPRPSEPGEQGNTG